MIGFLYPFSRAALLCEELEEAGAIDIIHHDAHGMVTCASISTLPHLAFAQQCFPNAAWLHAETIREWVERIFLALQPMLDAHEVLWCCTFSAHEQSSGRAKLIEQTFIEYLQKKRRKWLKQHIKIEDSLHQKFTHIRIHCISNTLGLVSVLPYEERAFFHHVCNMFPGGVARVLQTKEPPSRAYLKLREAQLHFEAIQPQDTCVDLGAAPGGWTWEAIERGARVIAVDRSELEAGLMKHEHVSFVTHNAFTFEPASPVDWLLCDVIAYPEKSIALMKQWIQRAWCKKWIVTIKFQGNNASDAISLCKETLRALPVDFTIRQLQNNKNEVTVFGKLR